jgi:hypothetical protein
MRQTIFFLAIMLFAAVLLAIGVGNASAEPQKNQISVPVKCDNGEKYTLVFNGEGNSGHLEVADPSNIIPKSYLVTYRDPETREVIATDEFHQGNWEGEEDLIHCTGKITTEIFGLGTVTAVLEFEGLITPRGK